MEVEVDQPFPHLNLTPTANVLSRTCFQTASEPFKGSSIENFMVESVQTGFSLTLEASILQSVVSNNRLRPFEVDFTVTVPFTCSFTDARQGRFLTVVRSNLPSWSSIK
eukprot:TRINITY_DN1670_c0_g1_i1.p2 TRINITY_DN1670_c0_g1~~TRINITY_DN1670_c0_g1_i1.p2  ORF type:complete len:109 (+),score=16.86 TRINITY_DN1670_c0_g1_i1:248-574(+)